MPKIAFGLAFDVQKSWSLRSGWKPAKKDLGAHLHLFAQPRLFGFVHAVRTGWAERMVVTGGLEGRYKNDNPQPSRGEMIAHMMIMDHGIEPDKVRGVVSKSNTGGNIAAMKKIIADEGIELSDCAVVTNHYHIPRAVMDLHAAGLGSMAVVPAEALWLLGVHENERAGVRHLLYRMYGENDYARRVVEEIQGTFQKLEGTYKPRTDTLPAHLADEQPSRS